MPIAFSGSPASLSTHNQILYEETRMISMSHLTLRFFRNALLLTLVLAAAEMHLAAHAILKSSSPANGGSVTRADVPVKLTFNVRVDAARSKLQLVTPDASIVELPVSKWSSPDTLVSKLTGLKPGAYAIRWQVLAPDGHISRGEIPFTVRNP
jgi:methionine-rich copper-binding protein CopC